MVKASKSIDLPDNKPIILDNVTCTYCLCTLGDDPDNTKEHVIGRRFVPKGTLDGSWNLIVRACKSCNSRKSGLENDISAISLAGKIWFDTSGSKENAIKEAERKEKNSISIKTRKPVKDSQENLKIEVPLRNQGGLSTNMIAPPQVQKERVYELAALQIRAFFYFITYDEELRKGGVCLQGCHPVDFSHHGDWGNDLQKSFMNTVVDWKPIWYVNTAEGYYVLIMREHPSGECWSWAIEFNKNFRVIGFLGSRECAQEVYNNFNMLKLTEITEKNNVVWSYRNEAKLTNEEDVMFRLIE